jgi:hypothetical protein
MDTARLLESACTRAVSPDLQLLPTTFNNDSAMDHVQHGTVRILKRLFPALAIHRHQGLRRSDHSRRRSQDLEDPYPKYLPETAADDLRRQSLLCQVLHSPSFGSDAIEKRPHRIGRLFGYRPHSTPLNESAQDLA